MSVTPSSGLWVVCASCGEIVQRSAGAPLLLGYHSPTCPEQAGRIRRMGEPAELPAETTLRGDPGSETAVPAFSVRGRGGKAALGLVAAAGLIVTAVFLAVGRPSSTAVPPTASEGQASPFPASGNSPSPRNTAPHQGTAPSPGPLLPDRPSGGTGVRPPSPAASPPALTPPPGSVQVTFENGADGWSPFWGTITDAPAATPAFDGIPSLLLTASSGRYTAVGTTTDVAQLKPGDTVTYHVWSSGQSGSVQPFIYDDSHVARFGEPTNTSLSPRPGWFTLTWAIPPTSSVLAIGLQVTNPGSGSLRLAIAALWWPQS